MRVGIVAALPREVAGLVHGWKRMKSPAGVVVYTDGSAVVACAGMGAARVELAVEAAMAAVPLTNLISVGLAGACDPALHAGDIIRAGTVIDAGTGEKYVDADYRQVLVTADVVANVRNKEQFHRLYGAAAVDMEAATVGRLARKYSLGFGAIKSISDEADFEVEGLSQFATADGQFREAAFAFHAALRPTMWGKVIALGRNSTKAVDALTNVLRVELDLYKQRA